MQRHFAELCGLTLMQDDQLVEGGDQPRQHRRVEGVELLGKHSSQR